MIKNNNIQLFNGRSANPELLNLIHLAAMERVTSLPAGTKLTLESICGKEFWKELDNGERRSAGHCMVHLVKTGQLPFMIAESLHEYPVYYQLK